MAKSTAEDVIKRIKETKNNNKVKVSFTFDAEIYGQFVEKCKKSKVPYSRVLEELIKDFIK